MSIDFLAVVVDGGLGLAGALLAKSFSNSLAASAACADGADGATSLAAADVSTSPAVESV
jgi:hypothetical protein